MTIDDQEGDEMPLTGTTLDQERDGRLLEARPGHEPATADADADETLDRAPAQGDDARGAAGAARRSTVVIALAVGAVALLGLTAWSLLRADDLATERDDRRAAASVAGRFASATMGYDHRDLEGSLTAVTDLATQDYAETYQNAFFEELQPVVDELRARGRVHVRDVYVSEIGDDTATAVVSFDAVIRSTIGTRRLTGSYVRVDLEKEGSGWKADDLTFLATTQEGLDAPTAGGG